MTNAIGRREEESKQKQFRKYTGKSLNEATGAMK